MATLACHAGRAAQMNRLNMSRLKSGLSRKNLDAGKLLAVCLAVFPLFVLTWQSWINACLLLALLLSLYILVKDRLQGATPAAKPDPWLRGFVLVMGAPAAAIFLGQLFRQEFTWPYYDSASKFLFAIPLVLAMIRWRINAIRFIEYAVPAAIFITAIRVFMHPEAGWGVERMTTYFVDPLTFGGICLTLALICLVAIDLHKPDRAWVRLYKFAGFAVGMYLSFLSGSRTGWLALPIVLWLWLRFRCHISHRLILAAVVLACAAVYLSVPVVKLRLDTAVSELLHYQWDKVNPDTSVEMRLSFYRIGWYLFGHSPFGGWGDKGFQSMLQAPALQKFASPYTLEFTLSAGFHNEIVTNMVRSGIWGLLSSLALFLMPMALFIKGLRSHSTVIKSHAVLAASYFICVIVSGMSTEVFNLKYTASFHAMMLACFTGTLLMLMRADQTRKNI